MPSLEVAQVITEPSTEEDLIKLQAKFAIETIAIFEEGVLQHASHIFLSDTPLITRVAYLADIVVRPH